MTVEALIKELKKCDPNKRIEIEIHQIDLNFCDGEAWTADISVVDCNSEVVVIYGRD